MIKRTVRTRVVAPPAPTAEKVRFVCPCGAALRVPVQRVNGHGRCPVCVQRLLLTGTKDRQGRWHLEAIYLGNTDSSGSTFIIEGPPPASVRKPLVVKTAPAKAGTKTMKAVPAKAPTKVAPKAPTGSYRIEDHFQEVAEVPEKLSFKCPCGRKLVSRPNMVDKRGKCPYCQARLLLVGKVNPRTRKLEIHPLVVESPRSGDTMVID
jgi:DNA-directed RNA polymerase subunit RPC12/RpoP